MGGFGTCDYRDAARLNVPISPRVATCRWSTVTKARTLFAFVNEAQDVPRIATEPVEADHHQFVAGSPIARSAQPSARIRSSRVTRF